MAECAPTVKGEIKKARVGNYDFVSGIFEFIDNAIDVKANRILINIRNRGDDYPHKILISDNNLNGIDKKIISKIFSWTFERDRSKNEIGEYGTGFKTAAVNLGEKLTVLTKDGNTGRCYQAIADWPDMSDSNRWEPRVQEIDEEIYGDTHPFSNGTTFLIEGLRYEMILLSSNGEVTTSMQLVSDLYDKIVYSYRYLLRDSNLDIILKGSFMNSKEMIEKRILDHGYFYDDSEKRIDELVSKIRVYQDQSNFFRIFFQGVENKKWEMVHFIEKRKNGNNHLKSDEYKESLFSSLRLVEELNFKTIFDRSKKGTFFNNKPCSMDIIHSGRVVGCDILLRNSVPDLPIFCKHELWYESYFLNSLLSISYNKKNNGIRENDLIYTLEFLHDLHEKKVKRILQLDGTKEKALEIVASDKETTDNDKKQRKNFSSQTKIQTLTRQECRDSLLDFILKETILPMDYDHKNGVNNINSPDNCQALSVITHAIKTRYPDIYTTIGKDTESKISFIVDLLNCITRSKYFTDALARGQIKIDRTNIQNKGLFNHKI